VVADVFCVDAGGILSGWLLSVQRLFATGIADILLGGEAATTVPPGVWLMGLSCVGIFVAGS
jgi:hypothetical protein